MADSGGVVFVMTTVESRADANVLSRSLVDRSLAACVQVDGPITSHYQWAGKTHQAEEYRLMIKTSASAWPKLKQQLAKLHPYDEPEIIMIPVADVTDGYRDWVVEQTT